MALDTCTEPVVDIVVGNDCDNCADIEAKLALKQNKLTAGSNIQIVGNTISATDTKYTAGANISISGTTISATDTKYTAGNGISISGTTISSTVPTYTAGNNIQISGSTISATDTKYTAGTNISISNSNVISATDTKYTAGTNVSISSGNVISATDTKYGTMTGATSSAAGAAGLVPKPAAGKQNAFLRGDGTWATPTDTKYTAGTNVSISSSNVISATDTKYTGSAPISVSGTVVSHNDSGVTADTYGTTSTSAVTPSFGGTFTVPGFHVGVKGHISSAGAHTVKIPNTTATTTTAGLMSASDKAKLNGIEANATKNELHTSYTTLTGSAKTITPETSTTWTLTADANNSGSVPSDTDFLFAGLTGWNTGQGYGHPADIRITTLASDRRAVTFYIRIHNNSRDTTYTFTPTLQLMWMAIK